eukprot:TRINITY_DN11481_c0_g1_i1.p1 TRINITY_DN11481_c0_g1~~TRINITY_DN11481_c0_g1_i1.p1  ORF type:complete len:549 (-),score=152.41 TRINITY_DN11481_c0_g1_i1:8-1654(-)
MSLRDRLQELRIFVKDEWLDACSSHLIGLDASIRGNAVRLLEQIYEQVLCANLHDCACASLPPLTKDQHELTGKFIVQVDELINIGDNCEVRDTDSSNRLFKLQLTDGVNTIGAIEYETIQALSSNSPIGLKLLLANVRVAGGLLLLTPQTVSVLGGQVESLERVNAAARARRRKKYQSLRDEAELAADDEEALRDAGSDVPPAQTQQRVPQPTAAPAQQVARVPAPTSAQTPIILDDSVEVMIMPPPQPTQLVQPPPPQQYLRSNGASLPPQQRLPSGTTATYPYQPQRSVAPSPSGGTLPPSSMVVSETGAYTAVPSFSSPPLQSKPPASSVSVTPMQPQRTSSQKQQPQQPQQQPQQAKRPYSPLSADEDALRELEYDFVPQPQQPPANARAAIANVQPIVKRARGSPLAMPFPLVLLRSVMSGGFRDGTALIKAVVVELHKPLQWEGAFSVRATLDDGSGTTAIARLTNDVLQPIVGMSAAEFTALKDKKAVVAKLQVALRRLEGMMTLRASGNPAEPDVVMVAPPTVEQTAAWLQRVMHSTFP